jgi:hypothetical protein
MLSAKFHFNLGSGLRREDFFRNRPIRNKNYLWLPCLQMDRDKISILLRGLWKVIYIDCSFHPDPFAKMATAGHSCF